MIHTNKNSDDEKTIQQFISDYENGDVEMTLPQDVMQMDKPVLLYIISRLLAK